MNISFAKNKLQKCANDDRTAQKVLGNRRAKLYKQRLDDIAASDNLEGTRYLPGRFHELMGDRKGQWACDLDHPYRLIFEPHEHPIPSKKAGGYNWIEIKGVEILDITDYH